MRKRRSAFVFLVLLDLGVSADVPSENMPETAYDESETLPCESTPLFSIVGPQAVAARPTLPPSVLSHCLDLTARCCESYRKNRAKKLRPSLDALTILAVLFTVSSHSTVGMRPKFRETHFDPTHCPKRRSPCLR